MVSHETLVAELSVVSSMSTEDRLNHAQKRRIEQIRKWNEYEKKLNDANKPKANLGKSVKFGDCVTLLEAAARNDYDEVKHLLESKVNPNEANDDGLTALHQACIDNFDGIVELLLENGAYVNSVDSEFWTPLHAACTCGHTNIAQILVDRGANLLSLNADQNMPYDICEEEDTLVYIERAMAKKGITQEEINDSRSAKERKIMEDVVAMVESGGDIEKKDENGATILHIAAANGYVDLTRYFLLQTTNVNIQDNDGWTPLHAAACWCQMDIVEILGLESNGDPSIKNKLGELPADVTEDEEIKALLNKLKSQKEKRKKFHGFLKSNGRNSHARASGMRGQSFKGRSKRDKKNGISAVEAKSEAQFWIKGQDTETDMVPISKPQPNLLTSHDLEGNYVQTSNDSDSLSSESNISTENRKDIAPVEAPKRDNNNKGSKPTPSTADHDKSVPTKRSKNGLLSSKEGETLSDYKKRRSKDAGDPAAHKSRSIGSPALDGDRLAIYQQVAGSKSRKKRSCLIL
nr:protein phosphatase 1 regulatory inhibitor subunit 16B-like isoform X1 [Ciona intestinalis]|eukprot:XP_002122972.1 protein phosphatase 1 regulatory inhibitor subunit 16B-like isoform X1 [Ciona intestinalis]